MVELGSSLSIETLGFGWEFWCLEEGPSKGESKGKGDAVCKHLEAASGAPGDAPGWAGSTGPLCLSAGLCKGCWAHRAMLPGQGKGMTMPSPEAMSPCSRRCPGSPTSTTPASTG